MRKNNQRENNHFLAGLAFGAAATGVTLAIIGQQKERILSWRAAGLGREEEALRAASKPVPMALILRRQALEAEIGLRQARRRGDWDASELE